MPALGYKAQINRVYRLCFWLGRIIFRLKWVRVFLPNATKSLHPHTWTQESGLGLPMHTIVRTGSWPRLEGQDRPQMGMKNVKPQFMQTLVRSVVPKLHTHAGQIYLDRERVSREVFSFKCIHIYI